MDCETWQVPYPQKNTRAAVGQMFPCPKSNHLEPASLSPKKSGMSGAESAEQTQKIIEKAKILCLNSNFLTHFQVGPNLQLVPRTKNYTHAHKYPEKNLDCSEPNSKLFGCIFQPFLRPHCHSILQSLSRARQRE